MTIQDFNLLNYTQSNTKDQEIVIVSTVLNYTDITINKVYELWGKPNSEEEWYNPHGDGIVKYFMYEFGDFYFNIHEDEETLRSFTIRNTQYVTNKGIKVGDSKDDMIRAYGNNYENMKIMIKWFSIMVGEQE